jgi:hypothetical protein
LVTTSLEIKPEAAVDLIGASAPALPGRQLATLAGDSSSALAHLQSAGQPSFLPGKTDYSILALEIAHGIRAGARSMIDACVLLHQGLLGCEGDAALKDGFLRALASENVIPKKSSRTGEGFEKSKLSMLRKIGAHADLLLDESLFQFLEPGRSILFHVVRLYEELPGDNQQRKAELVRRFSAQGGLSRRFLIDQIKLEEQARDKNEKEKSAEPWVSGINAREASQDFDLVLLTPSDDEVRRLDQYPFDEFSRRFIGDLRLSNDGYAIAVVRLADIGKVERLLGAFGFSQVSHVLLTHEPVDPIVTGSTVVLVGERAVTNGIDPHALQWLAPGQPLDVHDLAVRLYPNAKNRLHLFASAETDGWCSVIGQADGGAVNE